MIKIILTLLIGALAKGVLLFIIFQIGGDSSSLLELLIFLGVCVVLDWILLSYVYNELGNLSWVKSIGFSYLSFIGVLWITGPLFSIYNSLMNIEVNGDLSMPTTALLMFLILGFITTSIGAILWTNKRKKTTANTGHTS